MRKLERQPQKALVAVVDDDESMRDTTKDLLASAGFRTVTFASAEAFLSSRHSASATALIADMRMSGIDGLALHLQLATSGNPFPTILVTAYPEEAVRTRAMEAGVLCYLAKPFAAEALLAYVGIAIRARRKRATRSR
jgi:FixJ family two-component response regulator